MSTRLVLKNISAGYGLVRVLWSISLRVESGEIVAVLGPNGAGKTTLLRTILGLTDLYEGSIYLNEKDISRLTTDKRVRAGIALVPEGRQLFPYMTVRENLLLGGYIVKDPNRVKERFEYVFNLFPRLRERLNQRAGTLSGGEQQMLAIARALVSSPSILMLDEPSQGLAPKVVSEVFGVIKELKQEGLGVILVEQYVRDALNIADRVYILRGGRIILESFSEELSKREDLIKIYLS